MAVDSAYLLVGEGAMFHVEHFFLLVVAAWGSSG
jgi:hypothetical protein